MRNHSETELVMGGVFSNGPQPVFSPDNHRVTVALGSNLGRRETHLLRAIGELRKFSVCSLLKVSSFWQTAPIGGPPQGPFLNAVCQLDVRNISPFQVLRRLQKIELDHGRQRLVRWGPRTLDLDLLSFDQCIIEQPQLDLPHPRLHLRSFVLQPLCEIDPNWLHPTLAATARVLLRRLQRRGPTPGQTYEQVPFSSRHAA